MPHLTFWNRYWRVAGDEFSVPAFCSILVRIFWTCLVVVVFIVTYNTLKDCKSDGWIFILYLAFSIAIFVATIICDTAVLLVSLRGSITETYQRSSLGFYLNIKLFLGAMQFICAVFGLISLTAQSGIPCNQSFEQSRITKAFIFIIVISQLVDVLSLICCCYLFSANKIDEEEYEDEDDDGGYDVEAVATRTGTADKEGRSSGNISSSSTSGATYKKKRRKRTKHQEPKDESWAINTWENRCRRITRSIQICSCNIFGGGNITEGFDDVAKVLTDFFHHDGFLDVVPSDVVAGIVLVRMEQRSVRKARNHQQSVGIDGMSSQQQEPAMDVEAGDDHSRKDVVSSRDIAVEDDPEEDSNSTSNSSNNSNSSPHAPLNRTSFEINRSRNSGAQKTSSHSNRNNGGTAAAADHFAERRIPRSGISSSEFALGAAEEGTTTANAPPSGSSRVLIPVEELESIARCSVFALAIYTHLIVIYMQPCTGLCRLCASGFCNSAGAAAAQSSSSCCCLPAIVRSPSSSSSSSSAGPGAAGPGAGSAGSRAGEVGRGGTVVIEGDNCCGLNQTGLSIITEHLSNTELVFVSFRNDTTHKVYAVFLDHDKAQVVVAIRGTLSLEDCVTDAICDPVELESVGRQWGFDGRGKFAHSGMLKAALGIRAELEANDTLTRIFSGGAGDSTLQTPLRERQNCSHYKLVITGHSLGAGAAILLAMILKPTYPSLHCYAFGTPGSVLDKRSCAEVASFVTTVVMGNDLVCRLSFPSLCKLRNDVLDAISRARVNKMMIMQAIFKELDSADLMYPPGEEPDTPFKQNIAKFKQLIDARLHAKAQQLSQGGVEATELSIPGRLVHFCKALKTKSCTYNKTTYLVRTAPIEDFSEILVSTTMGADHFPDIYYFEIHRVLNERLRQQHTV